MPLCSHSQRTVTLLYPLVLRWETGSGVCESQRFCTQWMYFCDSSSQKSHTSCQTSLCTMKGHYAVMYRVVPSGFLASDRKTLWKQRLGALFGFSVTCIKNEARLMWSVPTGDNGTYENTTTAHTVTDISSARYIDESSPSVCRCCIVEPK